ncbi:HisK [Desulfamplus magnetovallimortis]|uniref:Histidinol-phosphatase n=1 Tax=Desulfamplus magnetovallimortis TaxID=1246637 RepID=A0A1W1H542_9BACT|nr:histidinol-phosphatase HisJ [Desulfamplus magnetovallimortis]SLM27603.1 HisK [Desulfamplus magnetovallimortis]
MTEETNLYQMVSVHGGHSREFCNHAQDTLESMILRYIELGFKWVGITEHIYPPSNELRYTDEIESGLDQKFLKENFKKYMSKCRVLQQKYQDKIKIYTAFETETYRGFKKLVLNAINNYKPDYIVGSVHHVDDHCIDYSPDSYQEAVKRAGGIHALYCRYFDIQYEMIETLSPAVVGHFDLIRIFDSNYKETIKAPDVWQRIVRNLKIIREKNLIMDFNLRALKKGAEEPYISAQILEKAKEFRINVVPGDDSHSVSDIGLNMAKGIRILQNAGFNMKWPKPRLYR